MLGGLPGARPRPVADVPSPALADGAVAAKAWVVALVAAAPLEAVPALPTAELATDAPGLCAAILRAIGSDRELRRLAPGGDAAELAARTGRLAGAMSPTGVAAAVADLRRALWDALAGELDPRDGELATAAALRVAHVCDVVLQSALAPSPAFAPPAGAAPAPAAVDPLAADPSPELLAARSAPVADESWVAAIERRLERAGPGGPPLAVLALDADGADRLLAADDGTAERALAEAETAIRGALADAGDLVPESPGRLWVVTEAPDARAARALGERLAAAGATATHRGVPLAFSVGLATWPEDGADAAALVAHADEGVFAARAAGVSLA